MSWIAGVFVVLAALGGLGLLGVLEDHAKAIATILTAVGAVLAIWATYKAVEEWDDPARHGKERLTSWGKFAIFLFILGGVLGAVADLDGDRTLKHIEARQDSLLMEVRDISRVLQSFAAADSIARVTRPAQPSPAETHNPTRERDAEATPREQP